MRKFLSYLFIFFATIAFAQAPGYLGKRFIIGYGAHISPSLTNGNAHNKTIIGHQINGSAESGSFAFNYTHEAFMEYALSTRFVLGFSCKFYKTTYDNGLNISNSSYYNSTNQYTINENVEGYYSIKGTSLCLYGKLYNKRYVAPWGRYIIFGPVINLYKTSYDSTIMYQTQTNYYTNEISKVSKYGELNQSFTGFNIIFGWGRSRIIANRITLDYGINMQLFSVMSLFTDQLFNSSSSKFSTKRTSDNYIEKTSGERIRGLNRINAFLKVGFLIF